MKNISTGESEGCLEVGRGEDLLAHDARLEPGRVLLHRVEDQVGVLLPKVLKDYERTTTWVKFRPKKVDMMRGHKTYS